MVIECRSTVRCTWMNKTCLNLLSIKYISIINFEFAAYSLVVIKWVCKNFETAYE